MRAHVLILSLVAFAFLLHQVHCQGSRSRGSQSRRPSTEAPAYDDYYYDEDGAEEETPKKSEKQPATSSTHSRGGSSHGGSSSSSSSSRNKPEPVDDYDEPPQKPSTPKPSSSSSSSSSRSKPTEPKPAAAAAEPEEQEPPKKTGPISPSTLFLAPRKNRLHRPNVHYAARPRPTLPSFIKHPPPLGAISTTEVPARIAITEAARTTAQPKLKTSTKATRFNNGNGGRRKERVTTESSVTSDSANAGRRFGKTGRTKNTLRPRFRAGAN